MVARRILIIAGVISIFTGSAAGVEFSVNSHRFDPYKQHKFRVKWDGRYVPGVIIVEGLHKQFSVVDRNTAGFRKFPLAPRYAPLVLKRGKTHDTAFENWVKEVEEYLRDPSQNSPFRKNIVIDIFNEANQLTLSYVIRGCWPSGYRAVDSFDANSPGTAMEVLILEHEGWERDSSVTEPQEP